MMVEDEEGFRGLNPEKDDDRGTPPPYNYEDELLEQEEIGMFECPRCGREVAADARACPGCGVAFAVEGQKTQPPDTVEEQMPSQYESAQEQAPLPRDPVEELTSLASDIDQEPPTSDTIEEPMSPYSETGEETIPQSSDLDEKEMPPSDIEEEPLPMPSYLAKDELPQPETDEVTDSTQEEFASDIEAESEIGSEKEQQVAKTVGEYTERRKKRYLYGALSLGFGIILFVLLWLVVVYQVLVIETDEWFGVDVVVILVGAGILFIIGLFLILTYPQSSIEELIASLSSNPLTGNPEMENLGNPQEQT